MAAADDLWTAVKAAYDADGLISLTNPRDRSATAVDDTIGTAAAQAVIDLWPLYAEAVYDETDSTHVEVGLLGVIAILWRRGGASSQIEQVKWDEVFGPEGLVQRVRRTGARARSAPSSNSGTAASDETVNGRTVRPCSDPDSLPVGFLPARRTGD